jgi:hypothetical protein
VRGHIKCGSINKTCKTTRHTAMAHGPWPETKNRTLNSELRAGMMYDVSCIMYDFHLHLLLAPCSLPFRAPLHMYMGALIWLLAFFVRDPRTALRGICGSQRLAQSPIASEGDVCSIRYMQHIYMYTIDGTMTL